MLKKNKIKKAFWVQARKLFGTLVAKSGRDLLDKHDETLGQLPAKSLNLIP